MPEIPKIKYARSVERSEELSQALERFIRRANQDLEGEVIRISRNERLMVGEGKAARVFSFELSGFPSPCRLCIKIWRDKPKRERSAVQYKQIQYRKPEEEFDLQDDLYQAGCKVPRPVAFGTVHDHINGRDITRDVVTMEEIPGYNLQEILDAKAKILSPSWYELLQIAAEIKNKGVVHRDIKPANIMLETTDELQPHAELRGKLYIIDFGLSRRIIGTNPKDEDFTEQMGNELIRYPKDIDELYQLNPKAHRDKSPFAN